MYLYMNFLNNLKSFIIVIKLVNMTYMLLYMHSIALYFSCLSVKFKKNLLLRAKTVHFLLYYTYETKEHGKHTIVHFGKSIRSVIPHLTSFIITQLHLFSFKKLQLFVLFHMRLHGNKPSFEQQF